MKESAVPDQTPNPAARQRFGIVLTVGLLLAAAGVSVRLDVVPGVVHGFLQMSSRLAPARQAIETLARESRER